ncbi:MAG TPA: hypothetical protein PLS53_01105 [Thermoanaerobaculaceae bacterium]|nr:hypothetical protein [Thermoanaerobaculaceae bacterium]HPS76733.1 hypothetical protein [Thermoanaerobaculaceae bacterium]
MSRRITFEWECQPVAEALVAGWWEELLAAAPPLVALELSACESAWLRLPDLADHLVVADGAVPRQRLLAAGFEASGDETAEGDTAFRHPGTILPAVLLRQGNAPAGRVLGVALKVERIAAFLAAQEIAAETAGSPLAPLRVARVWAGEDVEITAVERRGSTGFVPVTEAPERAVELLAGMERWQARWRWGTDPGGAMAEMLGLARRLAGELGVDRAAWAVFAVERANWARRNRAARVQRARQDQLGFGWANHDHHTFRSSREHFPVLIAILEALGFQPRERFYAGGEAGWGAQVMAQPACELVVFADVDLSSEEIEGDFGHRGLEPRGELGTIGLWCALHGESMLAAGLHHVAARLAFEAASAGLARHGVAMMAPFSSLPFLRQAFTEGERWGVTPQRLATLRGRDGVDDVALGRFAASGALGSHLEDIERNQGFGGFNQERVSDIIRRTDPRLGPPGA